MAVPLSYLRWLPVIIITGTIGAVASVPGPSLPNFLHHGVDKIAHAVVYGLLGASYLFAFSSLGKKFPYRISLTTSSICLCYGLGEEWYQQFTPGRRSDSFDLGADLIGFVAVISLWLIINLIMKKVE